MSGQTDQCPLSDDGPSSIGILLERGGIWRISRITNYAFEWEDATCARFADWDKPHGFSALGRVDIPVDCGEYVAGIGDATRGRRINVAPRWAGLRRVISWLGKAATVRLVKRRTELLATDALSSMCIDLLPVAYNV